MRQRQFMKVEDNKNLVRDMESHAILNVNVEAYNDYKKEREIRLKLNKIASEHDGLIKDINGMKTDISDIKNLLTALLTNKP